MTPKTLLKVDNTLPKIELVHESNNSKLLPKVENALRKMQPAKYQDFANRLNELMKAHGSPISTVTQIKEALGVTYEMARRYTLGTAKPREEKMKILAEAFGVSLSYLDHGSGEEEIIDNLRSKDLNKLINLLDYLDSKKQITPDLIKALNLMIKAATNSTQKEDDS